MRRTSITTRKLGRYGAYPFSALAMFLAGILLAACGGGGGSGGGAPGSTTINGSVFAAPVGGSGVTVRYANGSVAAGPVTTRIDGSFTIVVPSAVLSGDLRFEAVGGSFTDEATGLTAAAGRLAAYVEAGALVAGSTVHLTPVSTIAHDLRIAGMSRSQVDNVLRRAFGFTDNCATEPRNDNTATGPDNVAKRLAGLRAVAFSQMTKDLGLTPDNQCLLAAKIAEDLSDNVLNGKYGANDVILGAPLPEDLQNRFERAMDKAYDNASMNRTGLTADLIGALPFSKISHTATYRVEYIPGMMAAVQGRTQFKIKITRLSDNTAVTGLVASGSLNLIPWMHMATKSHATPWDNAIVDNGDGTYSCTVYFLMSSSMNGVSMGYWRLGVDIGPPGAAESAMFFPSVGMAMGTDTVRALLKGQQDNIATVPVERRTYYLFPDGAMAYDNGSTTHTLNLFLAAKESLTSFPAVRAGTTLHDVNGNPWTVTTISVDASTDNTVWRSGANTGGGHWSISGIPGLPRGTTGHVYIRLTVEGEQKTTDGLPPAGTNNYADISVTGP